MEQSKVNQNDDQEIANKLFSKSVGLKLPYKVKFIVGPSDNVKEFKVKDLIYIINSNEFNSLFHRPIKKESIEIIKIPDIDSTAFINLIRYVYSKQMITEFSELYSTYRAAEQYSISGLCEKLMQFCDDNLSIDNSTIIYDQLIQLDDLEMAKSKVAKVLDIINVHAFLAFQSKEFLKIRKDTLIKLLESDKLFIKEIDLYSSCLCWTYAQMNRTDLETTKIKELRNTRQNKLKIKSESTIFNSFKHLIRFPLFSEEQFFGKAKSSPAQSGLFNNVEKREFRKYFRTNELGQLKAVKYRADERNALKIGKLTLDEKTNQFKMINNLDDDANDSFSNFIDSVGSFDGLNEMDDQIRRVSIIKFTPPKKKRKTKENDQIESIRLFRIQSNCDQNYFDRGYHPQIQENGKNLNLTFRRYLANDKCYFEFYPHIELKKTKEYEFEFFTYDGHYDISTIKITKIYRRNNQIDVKMKLDRNQRYPKEIYFLYE